MTQEKQASKTERQQEFEWLQAAQRDPQAFEPIFQKYHHAIFNYVLRRTGNINAAQDISATTFMKALENLNKFRWRDISLSSWLYRIATNEVNQNFRKHKRLIPLSGELASTLREERGTDSQLLESEDAFLKNARYQRVHRVLGKLKLKYQTVLTLRYFEEKSIKEIAEILEMSENTVKTHIRRGLMQIRNLL